MRVYVNNEERQLYVYDRNTGVDYAQSVLCSQDRLERDELGGFVMTEEEYEQWVRLLDKLQVSEDIRFALRDKVDKDELSEYIYEETKYGTQTQQTIDMEYQALRELQEALEKGDTAWLKENGFQQTTEK